MDFEIIYYFIAVVCAAVQVTAAKRPNIIFIVADDLGWDDVSYHGSNQIFTPNIDAIAYYGCVLNNYYTDSTGTASRSALFTAKYPMRYGGQGVSIAAAEDRGIPVSEIFLPRYLKELGYATHLVGKWQLGKSRDYYWPTRKGFDSFYGFLDGSVDAYTHNLVENWDGNEFFGLNMYHNQEPLEDLTGYLTNILNDEAVHLIRNHNVSIPLYLHLSHGAPHAGGGQANLQCPFENNYHNEHIAHSPRRLYAGIVQNLDTNIGILMAALAEKDMLQNTIIVFTSDNGAPTKGVSQNYGINLPLRGIKGTPWEGAVRVPAIIWHPHVSPKVSNELFHVTDWVPTLLAAAGGAINRKLDGVNQWDVIMKNNKTKRNEVLITMDDLNGRAAYRKGDFKIIVGEVEKDISYYHGKRMKETKLIMKERNYENSLLEGETARVIKETLGINLNIELALAKRNRSSFQNIKNVPVGELCIPTKVKGCLYNVTADPTETQDLWLDNPDVVRDMTMRLRSFWTELKPRHEPKLDDRSDPSLRNYIWGAWLGDNDKLQEPPKDKPAFPLQVSIAEWQYLIDDNMKAFSEGINSYIKSMANSFVEKCKELFIS